MVVSSPNDRRDAGQGAFGNARYCTGHASSYAWVLCLVYTPAYWADDYI
jgi:hypothetical protein